MFVGRAGSSACTGSVAGLGLGLAMGMGVARPCLACSRKALPYQGAPGSSGPFKSSHASDGDSSAEVT